MRRRRFALAALILAEPLAGPAAAQYDRDGRYVPSPMGVPSDPNARPVPMHPGTPGPVLGTTPQGPPPPSLVLSPMRGQAGDAGQIRAPVVPLNAERCRQGWSRASGLAKRVFEARCRKFDLD
jgi:hypothetical protein